MFHLEVAKTSTVGMSGDLKIFLRILSEPKTDEGSEFWATMIINLFFLGGLFSHCRPREATGEFFFYPS